MRPASTPREHAPSRRAVLRGLGAGLALPFLESAAHARRVRGRPTESAHASAGARRLVYVYTPNGVHMPDWTPKASGWHFELPYLLEPLAPWREYLTVFTGLAQHNARALGDGPGDHARAGAVFLTGVHPLKTDGQVRLGPSADQLAARALGDVTPFRSLELGCERGGNSGQCDSGYSCAYSSNIAWQNATTPANKEVRPRLVFERLFRGGRSRSDEHARRERLAFRRSLIDAVREDARALRRGLGGDDRIKLDEYLSGVRELERRIQFAESDTVDAVPDSARPKDAPRDYREHLRLMMDLLVLALRTDRTRIATFMTANEGSNRAYRELRIADGHHELTHHRGDPEKLRHVRRINRFQAEQLAYLVGRLAETPDGPGDERNLLDSIQLVVGSGISDGNRHNHDDLPILLIGRGAGALHPGRHVRFEEERPLNDLHLRLVRNMGVELERFGDSSGPLEGV